MNRLIGYGMPLVAIAALIGMPGESDACWRRGRACPSACPTVQYQYCPPINVAPSVKVTSKKTGRVYTISDTGESEAHEKDVRPFNPLAKGVDPLNSFTGKARRVAKVSIANAPMEDFDSIADLLTGPNKLKSDSQMIDLGIPHGSDSDRVAAEKRNIRVRAFLYAFKKEGDNDYHVILGDPPGTANPRYFNVEISGLPTDEDEPTAEVKAKLKSSRVAFKSFFELGESGPGSYRKPNPPVEVIVAGSAFWDADHPPPNTVGPSTHKPKTAWEIHPITSIEFEP